jgi:hypothetical protein
LTAFFVSLFSVTHHVDASPTQSSVPSELLCTETRRHIPVFKAPEANSDWLASSLTTAKMVAAGAECIPFPYVKGAFGIVVVILETVEV